LVGLPSTGATVRLTQTASGPQPVAQRSEVIREEPGARDVQARICGGPGWATTQVYPAQGGRAADLKIFRMGTTTGSASVVVVMVAERGRHRRRCVFSAGRYTLVPWSS